MGTWTQPASGGDGCQEPEKERVRESNRVLVSWSGILNGRIRILVLDLFYVQKKSCATSNKHANKPHPRSFLPSLSEPQTLLSMTIWLAFITYIPSGNNLGPFGAY